VTKSVSTTLLLATAVANGLGAVNTSGSIVLPAGNYLVDGIANMEDTTSELMSCRVDIEKNGTPIWVGTLPCEGENGAIGGSQVLQAITQGFVSLNGTDALTLVVLCTGAAGTLTVSGQLRITAI